MFSFIKSIKYFNCFISQRTIILFKLQHIKCCKYFFTSIDINFGALDTLKTSGGFPPTVSPTQKLKIQFSIRKL